MVYLAFICIPACFSDSCIQEWKAFGEHSGSQALALLLAFIMNEYEEWWEPLFGGSSIWWTENWRGKKAALVKPQQECWAGGEKVQ